MEPNKAQQLAEEMEQVRRGGIGYGFFGNRELFGHLPAIGDQPGTTREGKYITNGLFKIICY
jgi:hypothetical protein